MTWNDLKTAVAGVIRTNGTQDITGALLQSTLNSIIDQVGSNATFKGVATPSTIPGSPDGPVFYIADKKGIYANFGGFVLDGGFAVLSNVTGSWAGTKFLKTEMDAKADHGYEEGETVKTLKAVEGLVNLGSETEPRYLKSVIENIINSDWIETHTDSDEKILYGVEGNGNFFFGNGVPEQIRTYIANALLTEMDAKADHGYEEGETVKTLKAVEGLVNLGSETEPRYLKSVIENIINSDWIETHTDSDEKILYGVEGNGNFFFGNGVPEQIRTYIANALLSIDTSSLLQLIDLKQDKLVSGNNIKTINGSSILGSGDISIQKEYVTVDNSVNIDSVSLSVNSAEIGYLFGRSINILNSVSDSIAKLQAFGKPNITVNGNIRTIIYPNNFNIKIGNSVTIPISLSTDGLKSIEITVNKLTKKTDFTFSDDKGKAYISDSIDIIDGKVYYTERIEKKIWHTGDTIPNIYLSSDTNGLVDGCTIYTPLLTATTTELSSVAVNINNGDNITSDGQAYYIYYELQYFIAKKYVDDPIVLTKMSHLNSLDGITVKSRNLAYDEENEILYFCGYGGTLYKIDVSDDAHPAIVGTLIVNNTAGHVCSGCAITNDYLYVVDRNEGIPTTPSYLTIINKSTYTIVNQINLFNQDDYYAPTNSAQSPCSCYIYDNHLYICENSYFWAIYDITTTPESPINVYQQTYASYADKTYREYQRAAFFTDGVNKYVAFAGFTSGVSIWNITNVNSPVMVGSIKTSAYFDYSTTQFQTMDLVVDYPYLYIPCSGTLSTRYSHFPINRSVLTFNLSDLNVYTNGVDYINNPSVFSVSNIPHKFYPNILNEGDPAPSRIIKVGNMIAVNYAEAGVAIFKVINNKPVFQSCYKLSGEGNTCQTMLASNKGRLFISNIYGKDTGMQVYRLGNMDF